MPASLPPRRLAKSLIRQLRLNRKARLIDVGCGNGELVRILRRAKVQAFGLFDGPTVSVGDNANDIPDLQPATLHQSIPFLVQSFDAVVVRATSDYEGTLATPQACTATANLLAVLKPGGRFVYCGATDFGALKQHLSCFPGQGKHTTLGAPGLLLRLAGLSRPGLPALQWTIPAEAISRLEWHRIAREAVTSLNRIVADDQGEESNHLADTSAA